MRYPKLPHTSNAYLASRKIIKGLLKRIKTKDIPCDCKLRNAFHHATSYHLPCPSTRINNESPIRSVLTAVEGNILAEIALRRSLLVQNAY